MYSLEQQLKEVLDRFCGSQSAGAGDYEVIVGQTSLGRVYGILVWNRFDTMEVTERQKKVWEFVRKEMSAEERKNISAIYTRGMSEWVVEEELKTQESPKLPWM